MEVNQCRERTEEVEKNDDCITMHPGFDSVEPMGVANCWDRTKNQIKEVIHHYAGSRA